MAAMATLATPNYFDMVQPLITACEHCHSLLDAEFVMWAPWTPWSSSLSSSTATMVTHLYEEASSKTTAELPEILDVIVELRVTLKKVIHLLLNQDYQRANEYLQFYHNRHKIWKLVSKLFQRPAGTTEKYAAQMEQRKRWYAERFYMITKEARHLAILTKPIKQAKASTKK
jgi:hypothetical protein